MLKTKELIDTLNKFGEVEGSGGSLTLYFKNSGSRDDIWIEEVGEGNCYITAYGCWDGKSGGILFNNKNKYKEG